MSKRRSAGEGSCYFHSGSKRWTSTLSLGVGPDGKRQSWHGGYHQYKREAVAELQQAIERHRQGQVVAAPHQTLADYLTRWLADKQPSLKPRSYDSIALNVHRIVDHLGIVQLSKLKPPAIQAAYTALLAKPLSRRSVEQCHTVLHGALEQAVRWELLARNPCDSVSVPRPERSEMQALTADQVRALFAAAIDDPLRPLWVLFATTGLRLGEALGLRWQDVDLEGSRLFVRQQLQRQVGAGLVFTSAKTHRSNRGVILAPGTVAVLYAHRAHQAEERLRVGPGWQDNGLVFARADGRPMEPSRVDEQFHEALERAGLPRVRVHDLRHTVASYLLSVGTHPKIVQELLGHSTISITLDLYTHSLPTMHSEAAARLDDLFRPAVRSAYQPPA